MRIGKLIYKLIFANNGIMHIKLLLTSFLTYIPR